jgi:hypothetical protein
VGALSPAEMAMQMAVSTLSPVIIQMLILALLSWERQYWMSSCSLSSTPVIPRSYMSC